MKEEIKVKNGVLRKFNIDETLDIIKIGYTINDFGPHNNNAIIVREGKGNNIITDNPDVFMKFINLYAYQNGIPMNEVFNNPAVNRLYGRDEKDLNSLIDKMSRLEEMRSRKTNNIVLMVTSLIASLVSCGVISYDEMKSGRIIVAVVAFIASFIAGKSYSDARSVSISRTRNRLLESIQEYGEELAKRR